MIGGGGGVGEGSKIQTLAVTFQTVGWGRTLCDAEDQDVDDDQVHEGGDDAGGLEGKEGSKIFKHSCKIPSSGRGRQF